jgi:hypothetical protein
MTQFIHRLIGATVLDKTTYEEIEADTGATSQAFVVVLLSALAAAIGARGFRTSGVAGFAMIGILALLAWSGWALLTYQIGARLFPEPQTRVDVGELLRTIGFASAPGMLRILGVVPALATPVFALSTVWMLAAMIVALRQALDYESTTRAILVCAVGWALTIAIVVVLGLLVPPLS